MELSARLYLGLLALVALGRLIELRHSRGNQQLLFQAGAVKAREPESQTNIPPVMLQEMTWTHGRGQVAASVQKMVNESAAVKGNAGTAGSRIARLTSGTLEGQKEFRGSGAASAWPRGAASPTTPGKVHRIETPGLFSRDYNNPLDTFVLQEIIGAGRALQTCAQY